MRFAIALLILFSGAASASRFTPDLSTLSGVPLHAAAAAEVQKALRDAGKGRPLQFAVGVPMPVALPQGQWMALDDGQWSWRARLRSPGALSLNLQFARAEIPQGGELYLYTPDGSVVQGPYSAAQRDAQGRLWTAIVPGEDAVVEVRLPHEGREALNLQVAQMHHGFRDFFKAGTKGIGESGSCNIDVACPQSTGWSNQIRGVTLLQRSGNDLCSGTMINNTAQDDKALLLTARHCAITSSNIASVFAYFNFQRSGCNSGTNGNYAQNLQGMSHLATTAEGADSTLIELMPGSQTQNLEAFGAFLVGWDARGQIPSSGASIHHPSGDNKKITLYNAAPTKAEDECIGGTGPSCLGGFRADAWEVHWSDGTTEQGSSGSGLYDQGGLLIGVLSGGGASCSSLTAPDYYARLEVAFADLRPHLAPGSTATSLPGKNVGTGGGTTTGGTTTGGMTLQPDGGGGALPLALLAAMLIFAAWRRR